MEKTFFSKITAYSAALAVIAGSAVSCSKKNDSQGKSKDAQKIMAAAYHAEFIDTGIDNVDGLFKAGDGKYIISAYDYRKDSGPSIPTFYLTDGEFADFQEIKLDLEPVGDDGKEVYYQDCIAPDGDIVLFETVTDYGDAEKPDYDDPDFDYENFDWEEYYNSATREYKLLVFDIDGNKKSESDLSDLKDYQDEDGDLSMGRIQSIGGGKLIASIYGEMDDNNIIITTDGKCEGDLDVGGANYIDSYAPLSDGTIAVSGYFDNDQYIKFVDSNTLSLTGDEIKLSDAGLQNAYGGLIEGTGDYKLYMNASSGLFGIKEDGTSEEIVNWLDSDLGDGVNSILPLENGDFIVSSYDYNSGESGLYRLTKRDASELENLKVITVGVLYDDWEVKQKLSAFNKEHDDIRFKMVDYSKYDNYDSETGKTISSGADQLKKDIVSGNAPDMIVSYNKSLINSLHNKGLFIDLYEMLDNDPDLSRDDIMPNVLKSCEIGGKLLSIAPTFTVQTYVAKSKYVSGPDWTVDDLISAYDNMPEGMRLNTFDTKEEILGMLLYSTGDLIDYEKGTCNFDTPEFRSLMAFCDKFPSMDDVIDWEDREAVMDYYSDDNIQNDKVLLENLYISDFRDYTQQMNGRFKDQDMTFVGYPTNDGHGAVLSLSQNFAILSNAEDKEACWNLIKEFMKTEDDSEDNSNYYYRYGFPSLKADFDKLAEESMSKPKYKDEDGKEHEEDLTYYVKDKEIKVDPLSEEQKNFIVDYIENATKTQADFDPEVESILEEEVMAYLKGEKTADEVIDLLQSRVSLLVSEQS